MVHVLSKVDIVIGAQWGDEGKGKWVQRLAHSYELVVRFQGGDNAGHTIYHRGDKFVLHHLPSAILAPQINCVLAAGMVINPAALVQECQALAAHTELTPTRLWLSAAAHVITPAHIWQDQQQEQHTAIGTTGRGIGPAYSTKALRSGLRMADYVNAKQRAAWLQHMHHDPHFVASQRSAPHAWEEFNDAASYLQPFVTDADRQVRQQLRRGAAVLFEGAQGVLLDNTYGTYPYVTASSTLAAAALCNVGIAPRACGKIYGIAKAYLTRVGNGAFPSELHDDTAEKLRQRGAEWGATTQRPRRIGWFDCVALRYAQELNGFDGVVLNKLDVLSGLPVVKLCVAYNHPDLGQLLEFPCDYRILEKCQPVWEEYQGWTAAIPTRGHIAALPPAALRYVNSIESLAECNIIGVGTGVAAEDVLMR